MRVLVIASLLMSCAAYGDKCKNSFVTYSASAPSGGGDNLQTSKEMVSASASIGVEGVSGLSFQELNALFQRLRFYLAAPEVSHSSEHRAAVKVSPGLPRHATPTMRLVILEPEKGESVGSARQEISCSASKGRQIRRSARRLRKQGKSINGLIGFDYMLSGRAIDSDSQLIVQFRLARVSKPKSKGVNNWEVKLPLSEHDFVIVGAPNPFDSILLPPISVQAESLSCALQSEREVRIYSDKDESVLGCLGDDDLLDFNVVLAEEYVGDQFLVRLGQADLFYDIYGSKLKDKQATELGRVRLNEIAISERELAFIRLVKTVAYLDLGMDRDASATYAKIEERHRNASTDFEVRLLSAFLRGRSGINIEQEIQYLVDSNPYRPELYRMMVMSELRGLSKRNKDANSLLNDALKIIAAIESKSPFSDSWMHEVSMIIRQTLTGPFSSNSASG